LQTYGLELPGNADRDAQPLATTPAHQAADTPIDDYVRATLPGVSVVTCCRNRTENLLRALPSWLAEPGIAEVVIVDWTSDIPVAQALRKAGLTDPRIVIARIEDEPRWVLSYAFNLGFRLAQHGTILKLDADIMLSKGFLCRNPAVPGQFIAGNWRSAPKGQEFVNGVFQVARHDLLAAKGFNEFLTSYGWDDDELYERLISSGLCRVDLLPDSLHHQDHDDGARVGPTTGHSLTAWAELQDMPMFRTRTNRFLATLMPPWDSWRMMMPFRVTSLGTGDLMLQRSGPPPHQVPDHQKRLAERLAATEMLAWRVGLRVYDLDPDALITLLQTMPLARITALHVELMLSGAAVDVVSAPRFMLVDLEGGPALHDAAVFRKRVEGLVHQANCLGRQLVLRVPEPVVPQDGAKVPMIALHIPCGPAQELGPSENPANWPDAPVLRLSGVALAAPEGRVRPNRLFLDAQHGLGNRMRAMGSAAAIASATGRELVVVWQPDHHCECRLDDLFDYPGAVIAEGFLQDATASGLTVLNYMETEEGAAKDAPLKLGEGCDAYLRSAYVIRHPASTWDSENRLLHRLQPCAAVRGLISGVPDHRDIALHIRMEGAGGTGLKSYDRAENWNAESHQDIVHWRGQSHYNRFLARLEQSLTKEPGARVFLAADLPETYRAFHAAHGDRIAWLDRPVFDRSALQLQYALADILLLARCRVLLGSHWSSFSEAALRMSQSITQHEMSGLDF
jgi:hypothetical protein